VITPTFTTTVPAGTLYSGTLRLASAGPVTASLAVFDGAGCSATDATWIDLPFCAIGMEMVKQVTDPYSATAQVGDVVTFTLRLTNTGVSTMTVLQLADFFDPHYLAYSASLPPADTVLSNTLIWNDLTTVWGDVAPGQVREVVMSFVALTVTDVTTNTAALVGENDCGCSLPVVLADPALLTIRPPTAVKLLYFRVGSLIGRHVTLEWATAVEVDTYGFNIYRSPLNDLALASPIGFVPAQGSGSFYSYLDTVPADRLWWYWLADVDTSGRETFTGPLMVMVGEWWRHQIYLPIVVRHGWPGPGMR
jgi:uncharacterized repeat protein (TIGR01451 family)